MNLAEHQWECVLVLGGHGRSVYSVSWGPGVPGSAKEGVKELGWLASTGGDGAIRVWEFSVGTSLLLLAGPLFSGITGTRR